MAKTELVVQKHSKMSLSRVLQCRVIVATKALNSCGLEVMVEATSHPWKMVVRIQPEWHFWICHFCSSEKPQKTEESTCTVCVCEGWLVIWLLVIKSMSKPSAWPLSDA